MKLSSPMLVLSVAVALAATGTAIASDRVLARNRIANNIKRNLIKVDEYASASTGKLKEIVQLDDTDFYRQLGIGSMSMPSNNKPSSGDNEDGGNSSSGGDSADGGSSSSGGDNADGGSSSSGGGSEDGGSSSSGGGGEDGGSSSSGGGSEEGGSSSSGGGSEDGGSSSSGGGSDGSNSDSSNGNNGSDSSSDGSDPSTSSTDTETDGTGTEDSPVEAPTEAAGAGATPTASPVGSGGIPASTPLSSPTVDEDATLVPTNTTDVCELCQQAVTKLADIDSDAVCDVKCVEIVEKLGGGPADLIADAVGILCVPLCAYAVNDGVNVVATDACASVDLC